MSAFNDEQINNIRETFLKEVSDIPYIKGSEAYSKEMERLTNEMCDALESFHRS